MADTAFEAITTRQAWYASEAVNKYDAVMLGSDGRYAKADGSRPFAGIVQYPAESAGDMCTVVRGTFPGVAAEAIAAGDYVKVSAGKFAVGTASDAVGVAISPANDADELVGVMMLESPVPAESSGGGDNGDDGDDTKNP